MTSNSTIQETNLVQRSCDSCYPLKNLLSVLDGVFTETETAQTVVDSYQDRVYYSSLFLDPVIPKKAAILDSVLFKDGSLLKRRQRTINNALWHKVNFSEKPH